MKIPSVMRYPKIGFWALHVLAIPTVFGGGIALGIFHATGHGAAPGGDHAAHAPPAHDATAHDVAAPKAVAPAPGASNSPIREEMVALQAAYDTLNRAVVLGDASGVAEAFHGVHALKQVTEAAIEAGTARPPRNADQMDAFIARDEAFHALLGTTVAAAARNDVPTLRRMTTELQAQCIGCHEVFR